MTHRYPTDEDLKKIREWPIKKTDDCYKLIEFVEKIWWLPEWGIWRSKGNKIHMSTGGWSGNEEIMGAVSSNTMFWVFAFQSHRRGGHYIFQVRR